MNNIDTLKEKLKDWGASKFSFGMVGDYLPERYRKLNYAISIAVRLSDAIINEIDDKPTHTYFHHYRAVNSLIDSITLKASLLIQEWGYLALAIPASQTVKTDEDAYTGIFQHKTAATLSGLGWIGKSALLITPEYGPRIRLGTIITNMELPVEGNMHKKDCGLCDLCKRMCPAMAIHGSNWHEGMERSHIIDAEACSKYMNEKFKHIGRGSVCGICMKVCPQGERVVRI
jgi:epoxyqueuosine reductase QueG